MCRNSYFTLRLIFCFVMLQKGNGTIDVNLNELEYIAGRLSPSECRRLIAALHYTSYDLPHNIAAAERNVNEEIPCLRQLVHWNSSPGEGRGKTHEALVHRLRQLNRIDLADWLGKRTFEELGRDVEELMEQPFADLGEQESETSLPWTTEATKTSTDHHEHWSQLDLFFAALLVALLAMFFLLLLGMLFNVNNEGKANYSTR